MDVLQRQLDTLVDELEQAKEMADQDIDPFALGDFVVRFFVNNA